MLKQKKVGLIGSGNMARALVSGLLHGEHVPASDIFASDHSPENAKAFAKHFGIHTTADNREVAQKADIVVLCVKPQVIEKVVREIAPAIHREKLVISIAAGVPTEFLESWLPPDTRVVRAMPNVAALVGAAATAVSPGSCAAKEDLDLAKEIFNAVGITVELEEVLQDAVTGLSGSGPAYIFLLIDSLADAGVKVGLSRHHALQLAAQTVYGSAKLLMETGEHPGKLKDMVTSPGGTAIAGIHTLEEGGLRTTVMNAVERATLRSRELGSGNRK